MIDERMEEQAALYALGALSPAESRAFEAAMRGDAELQRLVAALSTTAEALAGNVPAVEPPSGLKAKILAQINQQEKIVPLPAPSAAKYSFRSLVLPWALAAGLAFLCWALNVGENSLRVHYNVKTQELAQLRAEHEKSLNSLAELQKMAQALQQTTNDLQHTILALQETNRMANLRIAMLGSLLSDQPKAIAVSLWDNKNQNGVFVVQNLNPPPQGKDYQLWVIDPQYGTPVDAGVFKVDAQGNVRFEFKAKQLIKTAGKFAVTQEESGGSPTPKGTMVMVGG